MLFNNFFKIVQSNIYFIPFAVIAFIFATLPVKEEMKRASLLVILSVVCKDFPMGHGV